MPDNLARPLARLAGPLLIGLATGIRSTSGLAAVALTSRRTDSRVRAAAAVALAGELVVDKLPATPSRLEPAGLGARLVVGALAAAVLTRRGGACAPMVLASAAVGVAGAAAASVAGSRWRRIAAARFGADLPGALIEDVVGLGLAAGAVASRPGTWSARRSS